MKSHRPLHSLALVAVLGALLSLDGSPHAFLPSPAAFDAQLNPNATTFVVAGDSITAAGSDAVWAGKVGEASWINFVDPTGAGGTRVGWRGGWALGGAQSGDMARALRYRSANALVVLAGTNDLANRIPHETTGRNIERIALVASSDVVIISSVPPRDNASDATTEYNGFLQALAARHGWLFVDAAAGLRTAEGRFRPGLSDDGVHPNVAGAAVLGHAIGNALAGIRLLNGGPIQPATP